MEKEIICHFRMQSCQKTIKKLEKSGLLEEILNIITEALCKIGVAAPAEGAPSK